MNYKMQTREACFTGLFYIDSWTQPSAGVGSGVTSTVAVGVGSHRLVQVSARQSVPGLLQVLESLLVLVSACLTVLE